MKFSANLGFLWLELPFLERIHAAGRAGFRAVECHFPYDTPATETKAAMTAAGVEMISLNTALGSQDGDFGIAAVPGREAEAHEVIDQAIEYASAVGCQHVSVIGGKTGGTAEAEGYPGAS